MAKPAVFLETPAGPGESMSINTTTFNFRLTEATIQRNGGAVTVWGPEGEPVRAAAGGRYVFTDGTVDDADGDLLVEDLLYYSRNHDVWLSGADADAHYASQGWQEGRATGGLFDAQAYLAANPDVAASGIDPLTHYRVFGWREGRDPSPFFDTAAYLAANPDVAAAGIDPLEHYIAFGRFEGRSATPGALEVLGFDAAFYLEQNPDVARSGMNPQEHYVLFGRAEGRAANAVFDRDHYLAQNPDVAASGMDPLEHYLRFGWREQRSPSAGFDGGKYLADNPDVAEAGVNPMLHYLMHGLGEARAARPVHEAPAGLTLSALALEEARPGAAVGTVCARDPDGDGLTYSVDDGRFEVAGTLLKLKDGIAVDFEAEPVLCLALTATDSSGLSVTRRFELAVRDVNEAPAAPTLSPVPLYENLPGANLGRLFAADPDAGDSLCFSTADERFEVVDGNLLRLREGVSLDFETEAGIAVLVRATDSHGLWTERSLAVPVLDANDSPRDIRLSGFSLRENEAGAVVGTLTAVDPDAGDTHRFRVDDERFEVAGNLLKLKDGIALDHEAAATLHLRVTATDHDGQGLSVTNPFTLTVCDVPEAPVFGGTGTGTVIEDDESITYGRLTVTDPDAGQSSFREAVLESAYGTLSIDREGDWIYIFDGHDRPEVQALKAGESLLDVLTVQSADGTETQITVTIAGADEQPGIDFTFEDGLQGWESFGTVFDVNDLSVAEVLMSALPDGAPENDLAGLTAFFGGAEIGLPMPLHSEASGIRTTVQLEAGQVVSFDMWLVNELAGAPEGYECLALISLQNEAHAQIYGFSDTGQQWSNIYFTVEESGTYQLGFAALLYSDQEEPAFGLADLWLDNVRFSDPL